MNIVDIIIVVFIAISIYNGFRKGVINSAVTLVGTILAFIIAFYIKTPVSIFMYEHLPFFSIGGVFENITVINILIYEGLSFIVTLFLLLLIIKIVARVTGFVDKILGKLILLGLPSKILGALVGFVQGYLIVFLVLFAGVTFMTNNKYLNESKIKNEILNKTPILSGIVLETLNTVEEVYTICLNNENKEQANLESLDVLMKYEVLSYESANSLIESGKLKIQNAETVIEKYKESK